MNLNPVFVSPIPRSNTKTLYIFYSIIKEKYVKIHIITQIFGEI